MSDLVLTKEDTTPTPPTGTVSIYPKSDGIFYTKDSAGVERSLKGDKGDQGNVGPVSSWGTITGTLSNQTDLNSALSGKQSSLGFTAVPDSRQVNGHALTSDVTVSKTDVGLGNVANVDQTNPANITQDATHRFATDTEKSTWNGKQDALPTQAGNNGKYLQTNGSAVSWAAVDALPAQTGNTGRYLKTDGSSASWATVDAAGGVNYITNPDIESNVTGYNAYADAAGASPVDGTGGSPTVTAARTTTNPLRGTGSLLITKDAANRQGEGVSYDITISRADLAKVLTVSFDYELSGTYADGDVSVWILPLNGTNTTLIQPAPYTILNVSGSAKWQGEFQTTSDGTQYRIIWHVSTPSAFAYTMKLDNISVGPSVKVLGTVVTDATDWTPTGSWTSNTTYTGKRWRVGDRLFAEVKISLSGQPNASNLLVNLPAGLTIDTTKITSSSVNDAVLHRGAGRDAGVNGYDLSVSVDATNSRMAVYAIGTSSTYGTTSTNPVSQSVPFGWNTGDEIYLTFNVPIVGWSSSTVMSSDAATTVVSAAAYNDATQTIALNTYTQVAFNRTWHDTHGALSSNVFTCPVSGYYRVSGNIESSPAVWANAEGLAIVAYKNGSIYASMAKTYAQNAAAANVSLVASGSVTLKCNAGETISLYAFNGSGAQKTLIAGSNFSVERLSGPQQIAASAVVATVYRGIPSTTNISGEITFNPSVIDVSTHGGYSSGVQTCQVSGLYEVDFSTYINGNASALQYIRAKLYVNGVAVQTIVDSFDAAQSNFFRNFRGKFTPKQCFAGQTMYVTIQSNVTTPTYVAEGTEANVHHVAFKRVGGVN